MWLIILKRHLIIDRLQKKNALKALIYYIIRNVFAIHAFNKPCNPSNLIQMQTYPII